MTTGDEEAEDLVDNLFREVDDQFKDLEREYSQAREDLVAADPGRHDTPSDALEASNERFELQSQVATLHAELSRRDDELDERDRMLGELGDKIVGFQAEIAERDETLKELRATKQEALDERREQARLSALLDARAAERQELADVAQRLQNERDHVQELLTTALARFDEAETVRVTMDDKLRHLEAARDTAAQEHDARAHELIESRAEMSKLVDRVDELSRNATDADERAEKSEALAERRANEAGYLNRRIDAMNDKLTAANDTEKQLANLQRELARNERRISELERELATQESEAAAAQAAVDAIAERTSDYDELVTKIVTLEEERDAAWLAASGSAPESAATGNTAPIAASESDELADRAAELAGRARELSARRAQAAERAAAAAEAAAADIAADAQTEAAASVEAEALVEVEDELQDLDDEDVALIESDLASSAAPDGALPQIDVEAPAEPEGDDGLPPPPPAPIDSITEELPPPPPGPEAEPEHVADPELLSVPRLSDTAEVPVIVVAETDAPATEVPRLDTADPESHGTETELPEFEAPHVEAPATAAPELSALTAHVAAEAVPDLEVAEFEVPEIVAPAVGAATLSSAKSSVRKRAILPADLVPNTPEAVSYLLKQPGVIAIVDARSTCGRTGIRPSELFDRIARLRDDFDLPVEVVVTPVSTPVGGAPELPAVGVHYVTGADTVADRVRALCMGFPADQPLVVIAGDDHVRRAAIGEEANVVEPSAVLSLAAE